MKEFSQQLQSMLGYRLTTQQLSALTCYEEQLLDWSNRFNLTAIQEPGKIRTKHFLDSLTCMIVMQDTPIDKVIDVGSGAGFPGIPLKILNPRMQLTLVESVGKKVDFLQHVVKKLGLEQVEIINGRAETIGQDDHYRQK